MKTLVERKLQDGIEFLKKVLMLEDWSSYFDVCEKFNYKQSKGTITIRRTKRGVVPTHLQAVSSNIHIHPQLEPTLTNHFHQIS